MQADSRAIDRPCNVDVGIEAVEHAAGVRAPQLGIVFGAHLSANLRQKKADMPAGSAT
jgi:hypothetical protein